jgi:hypothetical protein
MMRIVVYACLLFGTISASGRSATQPTGSICGATLDENGSPARFIKVVAIYVGPEGNSGPPEIGKTDESGHYCIEGLPPGDYVMSADDTEHGYPITARGGFFYSEPSPQQKVHITSINLTGHADWQIPYKAGVVKVQLTDARTGKQIPDITFRLNKRSGGGKTVSSPSTTPILIPPNEDIHFMVSAPGYRLWPGDGTKGALLNLLPGRTQNIAIALRPID